MFNFNVSYIAEIGHSGEIRLCEHKYSFKTAEFKCKIIVTAIETDHRADLDNLNIFISNIKNYNS